ncbi:MAG TPA: hypothetical protein VIL05_10310 [Thermoclostridium sp.]
MDENVSKALSSVSIALLIITAVTLFFMLYRKNSVITEIVSNNITERGPVYRTKNHEPGQDKVSGAIIIASVSNGLETDISINSVTVPKTVDINIFDFNLVNPSAMYSVEYVINSSGEVILVKYQESGGER